MLRRRRRASDVVSANMRVFVHANILMTDPFPSGVLSFSFVLEEELVQEEEVDDDRNTNESQANCDNVAEKEMGERRC